MFYMIACESVCFMYSCITASIRVYIYIMTCAFVCCFGVITNDDDDDDDCVSSMILHSEHRICMSEYISRT